MTKIKKSTNKRPKIDKKLEDDCIVPSPLPPDVAGDFVLEEDEKGQEDVLGYMSREAPDCNVKHLEKIKSEKVLGTRFNVWDVLTDNRRWWVISSPMNLYSQEHFPSLDYTLSFHIGLTTRVAARDRTSFSNEEMFALAWRKWAQATEAYDQAEEPEEYQAVGMRCREALLSFIGEAKNSVLFPSGPKAPKSGDFDGWTELIVNHWASGSGSKDLRSYIINNARCVWKYVNWLTHATNANRYEAEIAVDATENIFNGFITTYIRHTHGLPGRCSDCGSYKLFSHYIEEEQAYQPYCSACGWEGEIEKKPD